MNHHHTRLSLAYRLAIRNGNVKQSAVRGIRRRPEDDSHVRFLTVDDEKKLRYAIRSKLEWIEHEPEPDLALHTGLRRTDMYRRVVWENVNLALRVAIVPRSKNDEPVHVPLNGDAMHALRVFRSRGDGTGRAVRNAAGATLNVNAHWFPNAVRAAGTKDLRWHDLRHTFAGGLRQSGMPLGNIAELPGHKTLAMTRRHARLSIAKLHEAVSRHSNRPAIALGHVCEASVVASIQ